MALGYDDAGVPQKLGYRVSVHPALDELGTTGFPQSVQVRIEYARQTIVLHHNLLIHTVEGKWKRMIQVLARFQNALHRVVQPDRPDFVALAEDRDFVWCTLTQVERGEISPLPRPRWTDRMSRGLGRPYRSQSRCTASEPRPW